MKPGDRQRAREFAVVLDRVAVADLTMAPWTRVANALSTAGGMVAGPSDDFRLALRQRLIAVGAVAPAPAAPTAAPWRRRLVAAGAVMAIATGGAAATAVASEHALPGDRLYDVKRAVEHMQLALAHSDLAKGERYLAIASTRLGEVQALLRENDGPTTDPVLIQELRDTMSAMSDALAAGSQRFFDVFNRTADATVLAPLEHFLAQRSGALDEVRPLLPAELWQNQDTLVVEMDTIAARVATVTGHSVAGIAAPPQAIAPVPTFTARASRAADRDPLRTSVTKAVRDIDKAVAEARRNAEAAAKPQPKSEQQVEVERNVSKLVNIDLFGNGQASVGSLPGGVGQRQSVNSTELEPTTAAARLFGLLPLPFDTFQAAVPGSLSASLDFSRAGSKFAHMHVER
jgi:hypothetical protein